MNGPSTADEDTLLLEVQHEVVLGAFAKLRNETVFFDNSGRVSAPTRRIFMKFDVDYFSKICRENSSFIKIWQE